MGALWVNQYCHFQGRSFLSTQINIKLLLVDSKTLLGIS